VLKNKISKHGKHVWHIISFEKFHFDKRVFFLIKRKKRKKLLDFNNKKKKKTLLLTPIYTIKIRDFYVKLFNLIRKVHIRCFYALNDYE
jgi:hypothetical protein